MFILKGRWEEEQTDILYLEEVEEELDVYICKCVKKEDNVNGEREKERRKNSLNVMINCVGGEGYFNNFVLRAKRRAIIFNGLRMEERLRSV